MKDAAKRKGRAGGAAMMLGMFFAAVLAAFGLMFAFALLGGYILALGALAFFAARLAALVVI